MLRHYADLLYANWRSITVCSVGAGLVAMTLSILMLVSSPLYVASVSVTMQPSEEELRFNRAFMGVSQFNPATIIAQSHLERLLSRPVAERAIDLLTEEYGGTLPTREPGLFRHILSGVWYTWNVLNYGYYSPPEGREQLIEDLSNALNVEIVEGSYILNIEVQYNDPTIAAAAANAVVRAYVEEARSGFMREAENVAKSIDTLEADALKQLADLRAKHNATSNRLGVSDVAIELTVLVQARQNALLALRDARIELHGEEERLAKLRLSLAGQTDVNLVREIQQRITLGEADIERLTETVRQRRDNLAEIQIALNELQDAEEQLAELSLDIAAAETGLAELRSRRGSLDLANNSNLSQVLTINPATVPVYPFFPKVLVNTIAAAIAGALLSLVPAFLLDVLGRQVRTGYDLQQLVGVRALPSLWRRRLGGGRNWLDGTFDDVLKRRIAAGQGGAPNAPLLVTGYLEPQELSELAERLSRVGSSVMSDGKSSPAVALPPLTTPADWEALNGQTVVIALPTGLVDRDEVTLLNRQVEQNGLNPYFTVVL